MAQVQMHISGRGSWTWKDRAMQTPEKSSYELLKNLNHSYGASSGQIFPFLHQMNGAFPFTFKVEQLQPNF